MSFVGPMDGTVMGGGPKNSSSGRGKEMFDDVDDVDSIECE